VETQETDHLLRGVFVVFLVAAPVGANIFIEIEHVEAGETVSQFVGQVQSRGAAHPGTIVVDPSIGLRLVDVFDLPASHAVDHRHVANRTVVPLQFIAFASQRQQADQLGQGDHFGQVAVTVFALPRLVGLEAGRHDNCAYGDLQGLRLILQADTLAVDFKTFLAAVAVFPVNGRGCRVAARIGAINGFARGQTVVEFIRRFDRTGGHCGLDPGKIVAHSPRLHPDLNLEIAHIALCRRYFGPGVNGDVGMAEYLLDQIVQQLAGWLVGGEDRFELSCMSAQKR